MVIDRIGRDSVQYVKVCRSNLKTRVAKQEIYTFAPLTSGFWLKRRDLFNRHYEEAAHAADFGDADVASQCFRAISY